MFRKQVLFGGVLLGFALLIVFLNPLTSGFFLRAADDLEKGNVPIPVTASDEISDSRKTVYPTIVMVLDPKACTTSGMTREELIVEGKRWYENRCAGCHGRQGQGYPERGHFPALAGNGSVTAKNPQPMVRVMMNTDIHPVATEFFEDGALALLAYMRTSFGNDAPVICSGEVDVSVFP